MHRPAYISGPKAFLNYAKTWSLLRKRLQDPTPIKPPLLPAHLAQAAMPVCKQKLPALNGKGSVTASMEAIMQLFMDAWKKADRAINLAIYTTRTSLAKRIYKSDPKTTYRHILVLIENGFLRAKVQVRGGLQLLLNPDILVFEGGRASGPGVGAACGAVPAAPAVGRVGGVAAQAVAQAAAQVGQAGLVALAALFNQNEKGRKPS